MERYLQTQIGKEGERRKREAWTAARGFWAERRLHTILPDADEPGTGAEYILQRARAANTVRKELGLINTALIWARTKGLIERVPKIVLPAMPESEVEHLSKARFRKFLAGCRMPHVKLFAQLAVLTGARVSALLELKWDRVDFERRQINLNPAGRQQKANKGRAVVTMNPRLHDLLMAAKDGAQSEYVIEHNGLPIASIRKGMEAASERSGVHCTPHMLRHTAAVWMAEDRVPMEEIASFLGHKDTRITTRVYARFSPDYLQRAASSLDW